MRLGEIIIQILSFLLLLAVWRSAQQMIIRNLLIILIMSFGLHMLLEGLRWQFFPFMAGLLLAAVFILSGKGLPPSVGVIFGVLVFLSFGLGLGLPIPKLPELTGPYSVGTVEYYLVDDSRTEIYGESAGGPREIQLRIWYPAEEGTGSQLAPWVWHGEEVLPALAIEYDYPSFFFDHLIYAHSQAFLDAVPANGTFPVMIFLHGWTGYMEQSSAQMEELASQGFVIVAINHTYGSIETVFPDGRAFGFSRDALPEGVPQDVYDIASNTLVRQWVEDIGFVVDTLTSWNEEVGFLLAGKLDLTGIGLLGHSTGAGAAFEFCAQDLRCKAILAMDPWVEPDSDFVRENGVTQPLFMMHSEGWASRGRDRNTLRREEILANSNIDWWEITIRGTAHSDFSNVGFFSPLSAFLGAKGPLPGERIMEIVNAYSLAFLRQTILGEPQTLLDASSPDFPEALFDQHFIP